MLNYQPIIICDLTVRCHFVRRTVLLSSQEEKKRHDVELQRIVEENNQKLLEAQKRQVRLPTCLVLSLSVG